LANQLAEVMTLLKILSATEENQKQLESIRGKMTQFQAAFESLSNSIVNSDLIKRIVDGGTLVLSVLDKIISSVHTLPALATAAAGALAAIGNKGKLNVHMPFATDGNINRVKYENGVFNKGLQKQILQNGLYRRILSSTDYNVDGKALSA